ncbi:DUF2484 family protein [Vannielia litorea]|uniref:DUF2484 family protein n=1 Tax=Vannielia litorea TaxID=1217970 RepID=A0A1N6ES68_9RHOB|nr:DUF2484 family protein [Vannielia litorea]SIN85962.1 Protein of unknown function [Vannielia litorea]
MTPSLICFFAWALAANLAAMIPSKDNHWTRAYVLIAAGIPLLGWVTYQNGPLIGIICMAAGASVLRWPVVYFWRWIRSGGRGKAGS